MKRLLFYYPTPFDTLRGGIERVTNKLAKELNKYGYDVFYLHLKNETTLGLKGKLDYSVQTFFLPESQLEHPDNIKYYQSLLQEKKIDVVINQQGLYEGTYFVSKVGYSNVKIISVLHSDPICGYRYLWHDLKTLREIGYVEWIKRLLGCCLYLNIKKERWRDIQVHYNFLLYSKQVICVLSESYLTTLQEINPFLLNRAVSISNPNTYDDVISIPRKEKIILFVGRLDNRSKKLRTLITIWKEIYKEYKDWKLIIIGDGEDKKNLTNLANGIKNIEFTGFLEPYEYYQRASIFCMTSIFEGFPMCLTEAMQFGCVPIAFDSFPAIHDIILPQQTGELVCPFSKREYIQKITYLMQNDSYRNELSRKAFNHVKKYDIKKIVECWINLIEK